MKKPKILFTLILFLAVWFIAAGVSIYVNSFYHHFLSWFETIVCAVFWAFPAPLLSLLIVTSLDKQIVASLNKQTAVLARIVCGILALLMLWGYVGLLRSMAFSPKNIIASVCQTNVRHLALAMFMYADENDNHLPPATSWVDATLPYVKSSRNYQCPADFSNARCSYAMNANLSGKNIKEIKHPEKVVLLYETDSPGMNPCGSIADFSAERRHLYDLSVAFADGHVKFYVFKTKSPPLEWK